MLFSPVDAGKCGHGFNNRADLTSAGSWLVWTAGGAAASTMS